MDPLEVIGWLVIQARVTSYRVVASLNPGKDCQSVLVFQAAPGLRQGAEAGWGVALMLADHMFI